MTNRTRSNGRGKVDGMLLRTKQITWTAKGKPRPVILWLVFRDDEPPVDGSLWCPKIVAWGVKSTGIHDK